MEKWKERKRFNVEKSGKEGKGSVLREKSVRNGRR